MSDQPTTAAKDRACSICGVDGALEPLIVNSGRRVCINGAACNARRQPTAAAGPAPEQAKANADAAFAVGALCGALGAVGREVLAAKVQHRFKEVIAEQEAPGESLGPWNRCVVIVPSGQDAPRTWRCWFPLPCPHHGSPDV